jgi:hypothetical protein
MRRPRGSAVFPLVVSELLDLGAVVLHDEDLAVGLRRICIEHFVPRLQPTLALIPGSSMESAYGFSFGLTVRSD